MKFGKIYTYENRDEAEIGKIYVFSDVYKYLCTCDAMCFVSNWCTELKAVRDDNEYPFESDRGSSYQFIREVIEEPVLMTNRQLSEWLAKANGQMKFEEPFVCSEEPYAYPYHVYNLEKENELVDKSIRIRLWESDEWVVPTVDIYERDCR